MTQTEAVQRVVLEAREHARADSQLDEQAWFEAGEDDTARDVPRVDVTSTSIVNAVRPRWEPYALIAGAVAIAVTGVLIGLRIAG